MKIGQNGDHTDLDDSHRWVPVYPGEGRLYTDASMVRGKSGLDLRVENDPQLRVIGVKSLRGSVRCFELSSYLENPDDAPSGIQEQRYWIMDYATTNHRTHDDVQKETYIIFKNSSTTICPGARLTVQRTTGNTIFLRYDSAVQVRKQNGHHQASQLPSFRARRQPVDSILVLEQKQAPPDLSRSQNVSSPTEFTPSRLPDRPVNHAIEFHQHIEVIAIYAGLIAWVASLGSIVAFGIFVIQPSHNKRLQTAATIILTLLSYYSFLFWFLIPRDVTKYVLQALYQKRWANSF